MNNESHDLFSLDEKSTTILSFFSWVGGDNAKIDITTIEDHLIFDRAEITSVLELLTKAKIIKMIDGYLSLTRKGSLVLDYSLLKIVTKWCTHSIIFHENPYRTFQWIFMIFYGYYKKKLLSNIRKGYILDFSNLFLERLSQHLKDYNLTEYSAIRKFIIRASLFPTKQFILKNGNKTDKRIKNILQRLLSARLVQLWNDDFYSDVLAFNTKIWGKANERKRTKKENSGNTRVSSR